MPSPYTAPFTLQPLTAERAADFWRVTDSVARERRYLSFLEIPEDLSAAYVRRQIEQDAPHILLLDGNQVVGWCDISPHERPVHSHCGTLGMGLLPSHRGMGLGGWLLENALAQAERRGYRRIELTVRADNPRALRLYERYGFQTEGRQRDAIRVDNRFHDLLSMARLSSGL
ncbi:GNAT family N-acetyltransferase [Chromobacterium violaceum]|uniref:GNAT family N-acetyltransferase n=1 Tax=Chromobacterium violaceum TaxID=536 RepID=UPI0005BBF968|nr:GNAT family N-acetyltransferase [Chromobacterium violaceum]MBT2866892.1 GNAT family N-acetyltransferase [Chromobacterium violaceum]OQS51154.1 GNAT family N-acetyltransferase [Chromobacterium violaceum]OQS53157.1 GNAT family N-acetyltransferase [Chromobacterium violaceum]QIY77897.1 GNAT family N-acetyltransferase [Chromobacterium violaceum]QRO34567.1 GNAT family N-acetyltransferase [Chromobacterium violaceum]